MHLAESNVLPVLFGIWIIYQKYNWSFGMNERNKPNDDKNKGNGDKRSGNNQQNPSNRQIQQLQHIAQTLCQYDQYITTLRIIGQPTILWMLLVQQRMYQNDSTQLLQGMSRAFRNLHRN
jgi:hypothetical protein